MAPRVGPAMAAKRNGPKPTPGGLAAGLLGGVKLKKSKGVEELENERRTRALEGRKVPDDFEIEEWLNSGSGWPGQPQVDYPSPGRMGRLFDIETDTQVVLVDFFAYSCTNCLRTVPILRGWLAKYQKYGFRIVAFHRPEFEFEKNIRNLNNFLQAFEIDYPVGLDNDSRGWEAWKVDSWPTHFLVPRPVKAGSPLVKGGDPHVGDRNHDDLETSIVDMLISRTKDVGVAAELRALKAAIAPLNRDLFFDMEFFLGSEHAAKNVGAAKCEDGVCAFVPKRLREQKSAGSLLEFLNNGHTGYAKLGQGDADWKHAPEYAIAATDTWSLEVLFKLTGPASKDAGVSVFMVAVPQEGSACNLQVRPVGSSDTPVNCAVGAADRHFLGRWPNGTALEVRGDSPVEIYTFYITTETAIFGTPVHSPSATQSTATRPPPLTAPVAPEGSGSDGGVTAASPRPSLDEDDANRGTITAATTAATTAAAAAASFGPSMGTPKGPPAIRRIVAREGGLERRPTGRRAKPRAVKPAAEDEEYLMPESSGRSTSLRIFAAYGEMHPDRSRTGVFTVRESTKLVGAYTLDICGEGDRVVHMMIRSGPGPQIQAGDTVFPTLKAFVHHYRQNPLDLPGMAAKGMSHVRLGECVSRGLSVGGGSRPSEAEDLQVTLSTLVKKEGRRIYHTVVVRRRADGSLPFTAERLMGRHVMIEVDPAVKTSVRDGDIILGINGQAVDAAQTIKVLRKAPKAFTMDVERTIIM
mmetsp:Transcript_35046/g.105655  ORF Transcript_35046/g.105655 Transcript_35046/m.105655 type:complete len:750 (-) Transcript_35046:90-2339(-)